MTGKTKGIAPPRHALDMKFHRSVHKELNALLNGKIVDNNANVIGRWIYADGNVVLQFQSSSGSGGSIKGEWDPAANYKVGDVVFFTPDGAGSRGYYALLANTGQPPDTGAPNWAGWSNGAPGQWL